MIECPSDDHVSFIQAGRAGGEYRDVRQRAQAACKAAEILVAEGYSGPKPSTDVLRPAAVEMMARQVKGEPLAAEIAKTMSKTPAGAIYVNNILNAYDMAVVGDSVRLRHYVTNKLIIESENTDARIRMKALELLGKIGDVGLFVERSEVTVHNKSTTELENNLRDKIRKLMGSDSAEDAVMVSEPVHILTPLSADEALKDL